MTKFKKVTAVLLSVIMLVCMFSVPAGAESIADTAKDASSGKSYSTKINKSNNTADYKVKLSKAGTLSLKVTFQLYEVNVYIYDKDGNTVKPSDRSATSGSTTYNSYYGRTTCTWNKVAEKFNGTIKYELKKGTYYIRFEKSIFGSNNDKEKLSFTATYPSDEESSNAVINYISIPMEVGDTMQLNAILSENSGETVTWTSSKTSVATIDKNGNVTAKKAGTTVITAKLGNSSMKIQIKVSK